MGDSLDFGRGPNRLVWSHPAFRIDEVGSEDGVDESGLSETGLAY